MNFKKIGKKMIFPHISVIFALVPTSTALLVYSMLSLPETSAVRILSYVLAFYTLTVLCARTPKMFRAVKNFRKNSRYARVWFGNARLRVNVSLAGSFLWNAVYGIFQTVLGIVYGSKWGLSIGAYYIMLAFMRFILARYSLKHKPGELEDKEFLLSRACGFMLLAMNIALSAMMVYMINSEKSAVYGEITVIAMAAYTFFAFVSAIVSTVRFRRFGSPVFTASKTVTLAAACVSMLTLENTMLSVFGDSGMTELKRRLFLGLSGGAVSVFLIFAAARLVKNKKSR